MNKRVLCINAEPLPGDYDDEHTLLREGQTYNVRYYAWGYGRDKKEYDGYWLAEIDRYLFQIERFVDLEESEDFKIEEDEYDKHPAPSYAGMEEAPPPSRPIPR